MSSAQIFSGSRVLSSMDASLEFFNGVAPMTAGCLPKTYLADIDAGAELSLDHLLGSVLGRDLHEIEPRVLVEPIKPEVAVVIAHRFSNDVFILHKPHLRALNAFHNV